MNQFDQFQQGNEIFIRNSIREFTGVVQKQTQELNLAIHWLKITTINLQHVLI